MQREGRQQTRIITEKIIYPRIVVKPINSPEKMKVMAVAGYMIYLEGVSQPLLVALRKKVIQLKIK